MRGIHNQAGRPVFLAGEDPVFEELAGPIAVSGAVELSPSEVKGYRSADLVRLNRLFLLIQNNERILSVLFRVPEEDLRVFNGEFSGLLANAAEGPAADQKRHLVRAENRLRDFLVEHTKDPDMYQNFEQLIFGLRNTDDIFLAESLFPANLVNALREHGKRLLGIDEIEKRIENRFGVEIETENFWPFSERSLIWRGRLGEIKAFLLVLEKTLAFLPLELRQKARVKKIFLTTEVIVDKKTAGTESPKILGGQAIPGHFVYNGNPNTFFHEFFHCLDFSDGLVWNDFGYLFETYGPREGAGLYRGFMKHKINRFFQRVDKNENPVDDEILSGFSSSYGAENFFKSGNFTEDQADLVADMILGPLFRVIYRLVLPDEWAARYPEEKAMTVSPVLEAKVNWMMEFLKKKSDGLMDEAFWIDFSRSGGDFKKIDEAYWQKKRMTLQAGL